MNTSRAGRARSVAFWIVTVLVVQENVSGFFWALFHLEYITANLAHLGYPPYFLNVVGLGQLLCALAILTPGFQRAKEWGYAGALLNYCAAAYSHFTVGDPTGAWSPPLVFATLTLTSWALRSPDRRLAPSSEFVSKRAWAIASGVLVLMTIVALLTLPDHLARARNAVNLGPTLPTVAATVAVETKTAIPSKNMAKPTSSAEKRGSRNIGESQPEKVPKARCVS